MFRKIFLSATLLLALVVSALLTSAATHAAPALPLSLTQENNSAVDYDTWHDWADASFNGGTARATWLVNNEARFSFTGTSVTWLTEKGNFMGKAQVLIDGINKGTFDLYSSSAAYATAVSITFPRLADTRHTIVVKVLGQKNAAATSSYVHIDGFVVAGVTTQENSYKIQYNTWHGAASVNASGGTFRISGSSSASAEFIFTGTSVKWITAVGPAFGKAEVFIDNVSQGVVDLYAPAKQWKVFESYSGLSNAQHSLTIQVLGQKNPASLGTKVIVDGFTHQ